MKVTGVFLVFIMILTGFSSCASANFTKFSNDFQNIKQTDKCYIAAGFGFTEKNIENNGVINLCNMENWSGPELKVLDNAVLDPSKMVSKRSMELQPGSYRVQRVRKIQPPPPLLSAMRRIEVSLVFNFPDEAVDYKNNFSDLKSSFDSNYSGLGKFTWRNISKITNSF